MNNGYQVVRTAQPADSSIESVKKPAMEKTEFITIEEFCKYMQFKEQQILRFII
jgi:hypothetical protein